MSSDAPCGAKKVDESSSLLLQNDQNNDYQRGNCHDLSMEYTEEDGKSSPVVVNIDPTSVTTRNARWEFLIVLFLMVSLFLVVPANKSVLNKNAVSDRETSPTSNINMNTKSNNGMNAKTNINMNTKTNTKSNSNSDANNLDVLLSNSNYCDGCTCDSGGAVSPYKTNYIASMKMPVLGGVDLVEYFKHYESGSLTYRGKAIAAKSVSYASSYRGYTYYFATEENQATFNSNPSKYIPAYGGFCSLGISAEFCPSYAWDASCLGPNTDIGEWEILDGKLYFFLSSNAHAMFMSSQDTLLAAADKRWGEGGWGYWTAGDDDASSVETATTIMTEIMSEVEDLATTTDTFGEFDSESVYGTTLDSGLVFIQNTRALAV